MEDNKEPEAVPKYSCNILTSLNETTVILGKLLYYITFLVHSFALKCCVLIIASCREHLKKITSKKYASLMYFQFSIAPLCSLVKAFLLTTFAILVISETIFQIPMALNKVILKSHSKAFFYLFLSFPLLSLPLPNPLRPLLWRLKWYFRHSYLQ